MDQCTHEVRAEYWRKIIQACGQRPAKQSAKRWMNENGIREQSYYRWQRRFRQQAYAEMKENVSVPAATKNSELNFIEISCTAVPETNIRPFSNEPAAVIWTASFQIEISNDISDTLLSHILREVSDKLHPECPDCSPYFQQ